MRKMLPGFGVVGTPNSVRAYVPLLRSYGFKVVALWGRTKEDAAKVAAELNIPFHSSNVDEVNNPLKSPDHSNLLVSDFIFYHC